MDKKTIDELTASFRAMLVAKYGEDDVKGPSEAHDGVEFTSSMIEAGMRSDTINRAKKMLKRLPKHFDHLDVAAVEGISTGAAHALLYRLCKTGAIKRVRKGEYSKID